jgi:hypothetical protein
VRVAAAALFGAEDAWDGIEFDIVGELEKVRPGDERPLLDHPLLRLTTQLVGQLVEGGFAVFDSATDSAPGGVSVVPQPDGRGIVLAWSGHDRARDNGRASTYSMVCDAMDRTLREVVELLGYTVMPFGQAGALLVTGRRG